MKKKKTNNLAIPKIIIYTAKSLAFVSKNLAVRFCIKLFTTPIKHKTPKREWNMMHKATKTTLFIPELNKKIQVYQYGNTQKKALLVHGWSGRGTQLYKIAEGLQKKGYSTISYDAPAHGKSGSSTTLMTEFIACNFELEKQFGPFECAVGHSLGGMSLLNAVKRGFPTKKIITIGAADRIIDILHSFTKQLGLNTEIAERMKHKFEAKFGESMDNYDAARAAKNVTIPTLVIHDKNDYEVPIICGKTIYSQLTNGSFLETEKLGHRKILGNDWVIQNIINFID